MQIFLMIRKEIVLSDFQIRWIKQKYLFKTFITKIIRGQKVCHFCNHRSRVFRNDSFECFLFEQEFQEFSQSCEWFQLKLYFFFVIFSITPTKWSYSMFKPQAVGISDFKLTGFKAFWKHVTLFEVFKHIWQFS